MRMEISAWISCRIDGTLIVIKGYIRVLIRCRSPTYDVAAILTSIQSLLHDPNPNSPANAEAARLFQENKKEYVKRVRDTVEESWNS